LAGLRGRGGIQGPVVEIRLLGDRNLLGAYFYFLVWIYAVWINGADYAMAGGLMGTRERRGLVMGGAFVSDAGRRWWCGFCRSWDVKTLLAFGILVCAGDVEIRRASLWQTDTAHEGVGRGRCRDWGLRRCLCR